MHKVEERIAIALSFKVLERLRINTFQAIVFNNLACVITGSLFNGHFPVNAAAILSIRPGRAGKNDARVEEVKDSRRIGVERVLPRPGEAIK